MPIVKSLGSALVCVGGHRREAGGRSRRGGARERGDFTRKQSRAGAPRALGASDRTGCAWRRAVCGLLPRVCHRPHASLLSHCWPRSRVGGTRVAFGVFAPWPWSSARCTEAREWGGAGSPSPGRVLASFRPPDALLSCRRPRERLPTFVSFYFYRSRGKTASYSLDLHRPVWRPLLPVAAEHSKRVQPKSRCFRGNIKRTLGFEESVAEKAKYLINDILC